MTTKNLCIYHDYCTDGFASAWVFSRRCQLDSVEFDLMPLSYNMDYRAMGFPGIVAGRDVCVLDFSLPRDLMIECAAVASSFLVIDHHDTAEKECADLPFCKFDQKICGSMGAFKHYFPDMLPNDFLCYIQDYDLWKFKLPSSRSINAAIMSYPKTFEVFDDLKRRVTTDFSTLLAEGSAIRRFESRQVEEATKQPVFLNINGIVVPAVNSANNIGAIGEKLAADAHFAAIFYLRHDGKWKISLRSVAGKGFHVGEIAKKYGGGGHENASAFVTDDINAWIVR